MWCGQQTIPTCGPQSWAKLPAACKDLSPCLENSISQIIAYGPVIYQFNCLRWKTTLFVLLNELQTGIFFFHSYVRSSEYSEKCHWNFLVILLLSKRLPDPVKARHLICFSLRSAEGCEVQQGPSEEGVNHYQCLKIKLGKRVLDRNVHLRLAWVERILRPIQSRLSIFVDC